MRESDSHSPVPAQKMGMGHTSWICRCLSELPTSTFSSTIVSPEYNSHETLCGYYLRAASIRGQHLFEGGVYSRVASIQGNTEVPQLW